MDKPKQSVDTRHDFSRVTDDGHACCSRCPAVLTPATLKAICDSNRTVATLEGAKSAKQVSDEFRNASPENERLYQDAAARHEAEDALVELVERELHEQGMTKVPSYAIRSIAQVIKANQKALDFLGRM